MTAFSTAASRVGATSVDAIEPLVSINSITELRLTGTVTLAWGRAAATISTSNESPNAAIATWRRQPGRLGSDDGAMRAVVKAATAAPR